LSATEQPPGSQPPQEPTEEELRAAYEAELSRITSTDMIAQAVISLLNLGARRLAPASAEPGAPPAAERDLEQARDAIDAARALLEILERRMPQELGPLRDALSRLQMAYAREASEAPKAESQPGGGGEGGSAGNGGDGESGGDDGGGGEGAPGGQPPADSAQRRPGPAESSGRLWVPGS